MIEALRRFRREIDAIYSTIRGTGRVFVRDSSILERIQQLYAAWSAAIRPSLHDAGVSDKVLKQADRHLTNLARLTSRPRRVELLAALRMLRRVLLENVLTEAAVAAPFRFVPAVAEQRSSISEKLLPEIPDVPDFIVPRPLLGWIDNMRRFLRLHNFERNTFLMVPYRTRLAPLIAAIRTELDGVGLDMIVAREHHLTDDLYNPIACLLCCNYGIAVFDRAEHGQKHNSNIVYELAVMQMLKRHCLILKHASVREMPSDFLHKLYETYDSPADAVKRVSDWWRRINPVSP